VSTNFGIDINMSLETGGVGMMIGSINPHGRTTLGCIASNLPDSFSTSRTAPARWPVALFAQN
jgi:hypothetical protein